MPYSYITDPEHDDDGQPVDTSMGDAALQALGDEVAVMDDYGDAWTVDDILRSAG